MGIEGQTDDEQRPRVLIVDDDPGITRLIEMNARQLGLAALSINDSRHFEAALDRIKPTLIMLDVSMPDRDGLELISHLATCNYSGQIVVMSGKDDQFIKMSASIAVGRGLIVAGTLAKPFRKKELQELLIRTPKPSDERLS